MARMEEGEAAEGAVRTLAEALPVAAVFLKNGHLQRELMTGHAARAPSEPSSEPA